MIITRSTNPIQEPISLGDIKEHLNIIDDTSRDSHLTKLISASREYAESYTNRALVEQTWKLYLEAWPREDYIELPFPPLQSVSSIKYTDSDDTETTWTATYYEVDTDSEPGRVLLAYGETWPSATLHPKNPIEIEYVAGYDGDGGSPEDLAANIPERIKTAIKFDIELNFDRSSESFIKKLQESRDLLLNPYRVWTF